MCEITKKKKGNLMGCSIIKEESTYGNYHGLHWINTCETF